ncbi:MAG TPA: hypothetical protein VKB86_01955 [Pyrinomonadaceae bacterium]|nr:hypothetical protein [Pyrinomonadaceae bacterium]
MKKPKRAKLASTDQLIVQAFARLDRTALGISIGTLFGLAVFIMTNFLILKGGEHVGQNLQLLSQYFIGYKVTFVGSLIGFIYGFVFGFILGWSTAFLRNLFISIYIHIVKLRANWSSVQDFIDQP